MDEGGIKRLVETISSRTVFGWIDRWQKKGKEGDDVHMGNDLRVRSFGGDMAREMRLEWQPHEYQSFKIVPRRNIIHQLPTTNPIFPHQVQPLQHAFQPTITHLRRMHLDLTAP